MTIDVLTLSSTNNSIVNDVIVEEEPSKPAVGSFVGQCKWFNDMLGFGFVTVCEGTEKGKDIFTHWSGIKPLNSNYRTLKKGEYLNFNIVTGMNGLQAVDVTGINGGPLMCDFVSVTRGNESSFNTSNIPRRSFASQNTQTMSSQPQIVSGRSTHYPRQQNMSAIATPTQWHVVTKTGRKKNLAKYSKEGRMLMKQAKQEGTVLQ